MAGSVSGVSQMATGNPLNNVGGDQQMGIATADDFAGVGPGSGVQAWLYTKQPEVTGGFANNNGDATYWFNPFNADGTAIFTRPPAGTISNQNPRGLIYGPGFQNHNIRISKDFRFAERHSITFVAEAFNWLNHPNWNNPYFNPNNLTTTFGKITTKTSERQIQVALRYQF